MFSGVANKLERASYFLDNIKALAKAAGGFPYIKKRQELRANLDAFFFELISAKDFFLQGINDHYKLGLRKQSATNTKKLISKLESIGELTAINTVASIGDEISNKTSWLWILNNYRNSATHRELLHLGHVLKMDITVEKELFDKIRQGNLKIKPIYDGQDISSAPDVKKVKVPPENIKTYLFKDPEDPSKGNADIEVIPYCEESLQRMSDFLGEKYHNLGI